jgi:tripartite ATP-independent transporter DctM subunit
MGIDPSIIGLGGICLLLILLFLEMPVGIALFLVSFLGVSCIAGVPQACHIIARAIYDASSVHMWCLIPLFVLMGQFAFEAGTGSSLFRGARTWFGPLPGGLAMTTAATSAGFAAVCGDNIAGAVTMTSVCLPEMRKNNYDDSLSLASVCAGGILSFLIPPSLGFIIFGILANVNITSLFMGGVIPGIIIAILFMVVIYIICKRNPERGPSTAPTTWKEKFLALRYLWSVIVLILIVFGGIYTGIITVVEAGALGAFAALVIGLATRKIRWAGFKRAVMNTIKTTGMVFLLIAGAWSFAPFLSLSKIPMVVAGLMSGLHPLMIVICVLLFFFIGGMVFESAILMIITIPIFLPLWMAAGLDLVWFGVVLMVVVTISGITPPVGLIVYVVSGITGKSSGPIFKTATWFIVPALVCVVLLIIFPQLATFLPSVFHGM